MFTTTINKVIRKGATDKDTGKEKEIANSKHTHGLKEQQIWIWCRTAKSVWLSRNGRGEWQTIKFERQEEPDHVGPLLKRSDFYLE